MAPRSAARAGRAGNRLAVAAAASPIAAVTRSLRRFGLTTSRRGGPAATVAGIFMRVVIGVLRCRAAESRSCLFSLAQLGRFDAGAKTRCPADTLSRRERVLRAAARLTIPSSQLR